MAAKSVSMSTIKQLLRLHDQKKGKKEIARLLGISRNTVKKYLHTFSGLKFSIEELLTKEEMELTRLVKEQNPVEESERYKAFIEQLEYYKTELKREYVTRKLLWIEYRKRHPKGYEYAQFCRHLSECLKASEVAMVIHHDPGDQLYIDFVGKTWEVYDNLFGVESSKKQVFVANLGYSQYGYVEVVDSQTTEDFIGALRRCLEYLGGVPKCIVPDNLKSAVIKTDRYEPVLNRVLEDFSNHYGTTILPARSRKPKDKALVENMVKHVYSKIRGPLRDRKFFSLSELNEAIHEKLEDYNREPFQRKSTSRQFLFENEEKQLLLPLAKQKFELKKYRRVLVQKNSHIYLSEDQHYYSAPYAYLGKKVKVIYTSSLVSIYFNYSQIAVHQRNRKPHYYTSRREHLPSHFNDYKDRSPEYYKKWAVTQAIEVRQVVDKIFAGRHHPEQAYRTCEGIKHLAKKIDQSIFVKACQIAVAYQCYNYSFIKALIENRMTDQELPEGNCNTNKTSSTPMDIEVVKHENIRGKQYYQNQ